MYERPWVPSLTPQKRKGKKKKKNTIQPGRPYLISFLFVKWD
jgi:hypothetical protein